VAINLLIAPQINIFRSWFLKFFKIFFKISLIVKLIAGLVTRIKDIANPL